MFVLLSSSLSCRGAFRGTVDPSLFCQCVSFCGFFSLVNHFKLVLIADHLNWVKGNDHLVVEEKSPSFM